MKQRKVPHVPTKDELEQERRSGYRWYRRTDLVATDRMRLEVGANSYGSLVLEDTAVTRIEDKLARALVMIQTMTDVVIEQEEQRRARAIEQAAALEREQTQLRRAAQYGEWVQTLDASTPKSAITRSCGSPSRGCANRSPGLRTAIDSTNSEPTWSGPNSGSTSPSPSAPSRSPRASDPT